KRYYVPADWAARPEGGMEVHGGCTLIFDLDSLKLKYAIAKRLLNPDTVCSPTRGLNFEWIDRQQRYQSHELPLSMSLVGQYFGASAEGYLDAPFAMLHQH